jgi:uncharacterized membrane protein
MKSKNLNAILMLILVIASLVASAMALTKTTEAKVYLGDENIFIRGSDTAYGFNIDNVQPLTLYAQGDDPPVAMAQKIGNGAVIAFGGIACTRGGPPYPTQKWIKGETDVLFDKMFQYLTNGKAASSTKVLWYGNYGGASYSHVYHDANYCAWFINQLKENFGYTIDNTADSTFTEITPGLLASYDILVLPQIELGDSYSGGDPSQLPDNVVQTIDSFVEDNGKGLLICEQSDFQGYNYYLVSGKILQSFNFCSRGTYTPPGGTPKHLYFGFQSDAVYDDANRYRGTGGGNFWPTLNVDTTTSIGSAYQAASGETIFNDYSPCSLVEFGPGVIVYIVPDYQDGTPGETITYRVKVINTGTENLTANLTVSDNSGWSPTLQDNSTGFLELKDNFTTILSVTVPNGTPFSKEDKIVVTASAVEYPGISASSPCIAHVAERLEVTEDAYVDNQYPDQNFGDVNYMYIGRYSTNAQWAYIKFDNISDIPSSDITNVRLGLFCWKAYGVAQDMLCSGVGDDSWTELDVTWDTKPAPEATILDTTLVASGSQDLPQLYFWDVTSFVQQQYAGDQVASFCIRPADNCPPSTNRNFEARDWWDYRVRPFLEVTYTSENVPTTGVGVSITPSSKNGAPGAALTYTVTVTNNGSVADTYTLENSDTGGWSLNLSSSTLSSIAAGASGTATLTVTIPSSAVNGASDTVTVTATSQTDNTITSNDTCVANAVENVITGKGVQVSISPTSGSGKLGATLDFTVTVTNTGSSTDTFALTAADSKSWGPTLTITSTTLAAGAQRTGIRLSITIPSTASASDVSTITVTATGTGYDNSATCTATATGGGGGTSMLLYIGIAIVVIVIIAVVIIVLR